VNTQYYYYIQVAAWGTGIRGLMRGSPKVQSGAFSGQRQGWKTPTGPPGSALLLNV